jgi:hypothetical protein
VDGRARKSGTQQQHQLRGAELEVRRARLRQMEDTTLQPLVPQTEPRAVQ